MDFRILGPVEVFRDGKRVPLGGQRERALLGALLLRANQPASVSYLVEAVWDRELASPETNLRSYVTRLRRRLNLRPDDRGLVTLGGAYLLAVAPDELDTAVFEQLVAAAEQALATDELHHAAATFRRALALWRGEPMEGCRLGPGLRPELARLDELRLQAIEQYNDARMRLGQHAAIVGDLHRFVAGNPLREQLCAQLVLALYRLGRRAEALETYARARQQLAEALGVDPGPRLRHLHQAILHDDPGLTQHQETERPTVPMPRPAQLPADLACFTGRDDDLQRILALHSDDAGAPAVGTIDGMPGVGKTALATHAAHRLADRYPDGQLFLDLHGHTRHVKPLTTDQALAQFLHALGFPGERIPHQTQARSALYRSHLADRRMLIVLDNAHDEGQVNPLLPAAAGCLVLITSRRRLVDLDGTRVITLEPLSLPDSITLFRRVTPAHQLAGQPDELIAEVVQHCGRLPLAIRIVAARLRHRPAWSVANVATHLSEQQHLSELETAQRSVAGTIDLSYQQLKPERQRVFALLGLCPGVDIDARGTAALAGTTAAKARRALEDLVDTHLLQEHRPDRYHFHDLVRAHAAATGEELAEPDRHDALARLFDHYVATASQAVGVLFPHETDAPAPARTTDTQAESWMDTELANLLAAAHTAAGEWPEHTIRLSAILHHPLRSRGHYSDAEALHTHALRTARRTGDRAGELSALNCLGHIRRMQGRHDSALFEQAVGLARELGDRKRELYALYGLGIAHRVQGRYQEAFDCYRRMLRLARRVGDRTAGQRALYGIGSIHRIQGEYALARQRFDNALAVARELGDQVGEYNALTGIGVVLRSQRKYHAAGVRFEAALTAARACGYRSGELYALIGLGVVNRATGAHPSAVEWGRRALRLAEEIGDRNGQMEARIGLGYTQLATGEPTLALAEHGKALDLADALEQPEDRVRALNGLACAHRALGDAEDARRYWQRCVTLLTELGLPEVEEASLDDIQTYLATLAATNNARQP